MLSEPAACREPHSCASAFVYRSAPKCRFSATTAARAPARCGASRARSPA